MKDDWYAIDAEDVERIVEITEEHAGKTDDEIAAACRTYLESDARKYRRAMEQPKLKLIQGGLE
jgi:hypothetical protein